MAGRATGPIPGVAEELLAPGAAAEAEVFLAQNFLRRFGYLREGAFEPGIVNDATARALAATSNAMGWR